MQRDSISHVVIAGGGIVAWSAAAALKRRIGSLKVTVAACPVPQEALADRMISTLPSIAGFHDDIGLTEADTIARAESGLRIGTVFEGWAAGHPEYVHAYGSYGAPVRAAAFHQLWLSLCAAGKVQSFDRFSPAAELGRLDRIATAEPAGAGAPEIGYGLHLTLGRYHQLMRAYALHLGVAERTCANFEVQLRGDDGFVELLKLDDGSTLAGDLFVDCTGPDASLRSRTGGEFTGWSRWLPCDRLVLAEGAPDPEPAMLDRVEATQSGWQWRSSSPSRSSHGIAFSSSHSTGEQVLESVSGGAEIGIRQGAWAEPWVRNCVAIGDSSVMVEPLEWANLHLAHSQIDRLVSMMPGRDCAAVELAEYNRQCIAEAERVRDFICMHYIIARRDEPFWKEVAAIEPPPSLQHTLSLFAERGRLPYYEEETFSRDSWLAVLLGQGFRPRRTDPLADIVSAEEAERELARYGDFVRTFVQSQPNYSDYMSTLRQRSFQ
jgi:tryptophan halogenase